MLQMIIQGRGGQGAQKAGEILAHVFFQEGKYVQAYSTYGGARRGTPVSSFIRVDDRPIRLRCDIEHPDVIVCFDPSLLGGPLLDSAGQETLVIINSSKPAGHFDGLGRFKIATINAIPVAQANNLGRIVNTAVVGAVAGFLGQPGIEDLVKVVAQTSPAKVQENVNSCWDGYRLAQQKGVSIHGDS